MIREKMHAFSRKTKVKDVPRYPSSSPALKNGSSRQRARLKRALCSSKARGIALTSANVFTLNLKRCSTDWLRIARTVRRTRPSGVSPHKKIPGIRAGGAL